MPTLVIVRRPRTARSVTQTVRMRFLVGTAEVTASGAGRLCAEQNFVRSAAIGCIKVPSRASKSEIQVSRLERFSDSLGSDWARDERRERRGEVRRERVVDTAVECLQRFSPAECRNCFRHCGYSIATQS